MVGHSMAKKKKKMFTGQFGKSQPTTPRSKSARVFVNTTRRWKILIVAAVFGAIGLALLYGVFAAPTKTANFEGESFRINSHAGRINSVPASGGKAMRFRSNTTLSKAITLPQNAVKVIVRARGLQCNGAPKAVLKIDGTVIKTHTVKSKQWANYTSYPKVSAGPHTLAISFTNNYNKYKGAKRVCTRDLDIDKITFYSNVAEDPEDPDPEDPGDDLPTPSTTGYQHTGVTLQSCEQYVSGGNYVISGTSGGRVVDGCDFYNRQVRITGGGPVTLKRSRVRDNSNCDGACAAVYIANGAGPVTIEDVEITTTDPSVTLESQRQDRTITVAKNNTQPVTIRRVYAHDTTRGMELTGQNNITVENSYLAFNVSPPSNGNCGQERKHSSALKASGGTHHLTLTNNVFGVGECSFASGLLAFYPEGGANHDVTIDGGLWIIQSDNDGAFGISAGYTPPEERNYNFIVRNVQISTQYYTHGCPLAGSNTCAPLWNGSRSPSGTKIWENNTKYNPGKPDHGQPIEP